MVAVEVSLPDPQLPDQAATGERIVHEPVPCDGFRIKVGILQCTIGGTRAMAGHRITIKLMNFQCNGTYQPCSPSTHLRSPGRPVLQCSMAPLLAPLPAGAANGRRAICSLRLVGRRGHCGSRPHLLEKL